TPAPAVSAFAAALVAAAVTLTAFAAFARTAIFAAITASAVATATATSAVTAMPAFAAGLGRGAFGTSRLVGTAEKTFQPADEAAGFLFRGAILIGLVGAGLEASLLAPRFAGLE